MRLTITSDYRYQRTPDGTVWTDGPCNYQHFTRYLRVFDEVNVIARMRDVDRPAETLAPATGPDVSFSAVPFYQGPADFLRQRRRISAAAHAAVMPGDAILFNAPVPLSSLLQSRLSAGRPYGVQVLGDPYEVFAPGVVKHLLRPLLRWWATRSLQRLVRHASAALYVTEASLQRRYPTHGRAFSASDAHLPDSAFRSPEHVKARAAAFTIISVGSMAQMYKGYDVLIDAIARLRDSSFEIQLVLVGDGRYRPLLEEQTRRLKLTNVRFLGQLPAGDRIQEELDKAQLFVLPSRTEGLPRAVLEAMARSLPVVGSRVGGIPELVSEDALVPAGDAAALANALRKAISDELWRRKMSDYNYQRALCFRAEVLEAKQAEFYRHVAELTQSWTSRDVVRGPRLTGMVEEVLA